MNKKKEIIKEIVCVAAGMLFFLGLGLYKLTEAPLWFDEGIEFFYSKYLVGTIEGISDLPNMYQRIIVTYQPPLYNVLLYFWLQISEAEGWFRFSSVVFGLIGAFGIYKLVRLYKAAWIAGVSVIVYSCIHKVMYFSLECSEYILMLGMLIWTLYFFCVLWEKDSRKAQVCFVLFIVLSIYSQYGAAFLLIPLALTMLYHLWNTKQVKALRELFLMYVGAGVVAGLPLLYFFLRPQLANPDSTYSQRKVMGFENNNPLYDFGYWTSKSFRYMFIESDSRFPLLVGLGLGIVLVFGVFYLIKGKKQIIKALFSCSIISWVFYYVVVKLGIYAYGGFANRYGLFVLPIWYVTIFLLATESYGMLKDGLKNTSLEKLAYAWAAGLLLFAAGFSVYGTHQIDVHWDKLDCRGVADAWLDVEGYKELTFIDFNQNPSFTYYLRQDSRYEESMEDNFIRDRELHHFEKEQYRDYLLNNIFEGQFPEKFYLCGNATAQEIFREEGYTLEKIYDTTASLYWVYR